MLDWGVGVKLWDIFCPRLSFFWVNNRWACAWVRLKDMGVSALGPLPLWTFLSRARLALNISRHSSSNHVLDFLRTVVALGMLSFAALMTSSTKDVRGSWSWRICPVILSIHDSANRSQSAFGNTQWLESPAWSVSAEEGDRYQDRVVVTAMCVRKDLPCTSKGAIGYTDREVDGWCGVLWVLSLWF